MHKGDTFTHEFVVDQRVYDGFINVFQDRNPLHTDDAFAQDRGFTSRVMHGNILNGFLSFFVGECLPVKNVMIYSQQIDFKKPIFLGDKVFLKAEIAEVHESVNLIEFKFIFTGVNGTKLAKGQLQIGLLK